jgi:hypothetical protein
LRTWRLATRAAIPNLRPVERGDIVIDFTKLPGYNNAARVVFGLSLRRHGCI